MPKLIPTFCLAALLAAPSAHAQSSDAVRAGAAPLRPAPADGCTYDLCALRIEEGIVVQGLHGQQVASVGVLGGLAGRIEWRSDTARAYARRAESKQRTAMLLRGAGVVGTTAAGVLGFLAANAAGDGGTSASGVQTRIYAAVGLGAGAWLLEKLGANAHRQARQQLARAVWWHNRELVQSR
jgi:hypothetical protein